MFKEIAQGLFGNMNGFQYSGMRSGWLWIEFDLL
jgi:hypothetical protein